MILIYRKQTDSAVFRALRLDILSKRIEFSCAFLSTKKDRWQRDGKKGKWFESHTYDDTGVKQTGLYLGRLALVMIRGKISEGM